MAKIFEFQKENQHECPTCDLVDEYFEYAIEADSKDELRDILHELVMEAQQVAYKDGYKAALVTDIEVKMNVLDDMDGQCDCDGCTDGECELD